MKKNEIQNVFSRFELKFDYGTGQVNSTWSTSFHCKLCKKEAVKLQGRHTAWSEERDKDSPKALPTLLEHLKKHEMSPCKYCGLYITARGTKRHHQSKDCTAERRKFSMRERGYEVIKISRIKDAIDILKEQMTNFTDYDQLDEHQFIEEQANEAYKALLSKLEVVEVNSDFAEKYNSMVGRSRFSWAPETWAPANVSHYFGLLEDSNKFKAPPWRELKGVNSSQINFDKAYVLSQKYLEEISTFADSDESYRDGMICLLELHKETE